MFKTVRLLLQLLIIISLVLLSSCGDNSAGSQDAKQKHNHVWKSQTDTLDKAKAVEGVLQESADSQRQQIQDATE